MSIDAIHVSAEAAIANLYDVDAGSREYIVTGLSAHADDLERVRLPYICGRGVKLAF